jgi:hypothetical protein
VAWEIHRWPEICLVEQRQYRANWDGAATYAAAIAPVAGTYPDNSANEVFDVPTAQYFQSLQAGNINNKPTIGGVENSAWWAACKTQYAANDWLPGTDYNLADQVRDTATNLFYQCIAPHTSGAAFDGANWGLLTPFNKVIVYEQTGLTPIGEYFATFDKDPRVTTQLRRFPFWLSDAGAQFAVTAPAQLWIYYRTRRPTLLGDAWDSRALYAAGDQVYFAAVSGGSGNFYRALSAVTNGQSPATTPTRWQAVQIPYFLRGYLVEGGYADWLTSDGQADKAAAMEAGAGSYLELEADKVQRQQQQVARFLMSA